jgi:hypothetical protein
MMNLLALAFLELAGTARAQASPPSWVPDARFTLALYCNPTCAEEALDSLDARLTTMDSKGRLPMTARHPVRMMGLADAADFRPPDLDLLGTLASGLGDDGAQVLSGTRQVVVATFASPIAQAVPTLLEAYSAFSELASTTGGVIEEVETSRIYDASHFAEHRGDLFADALNVTSLFVIETTTLYVGDLAGQPDRFEISTRGLRALGLQELRVEDVSEDDVDDLAAMLDALAQIAFEKGTLPARTRVSEADVANPAVRRSTIGIDGIASCTYARPRDGEPPDPVALVTWEGRFDAPPLAGNPLGQAAEIVTPVAPALPIQALPVPGAPVPPAPAAEPLSVPPAPAAELPSAPPALAPTAQPPPASPSPAATPTPTEPPPVHRPVDLSEALVRDAMALSGPVHAAYDAGLQKGDSLFAKVPFDAGEGRREYLWFLVTGWKGSRMEGVLRSKPDWIQGLSEGDVRSFDQDEVFDWLLRHADGRTEGNLTQPFLR